VDIIADVYAAQTTITMNSSSSITANFESWHPEPVALGYRTGGNAPIYTDVPPGPMVVSVPQALTLTSVVINVAVLALMLTMVIQIYRHTGSLDSEKSRNLKG